MNLGTSYSILEKKLQRKRSSFPLHDKSYLILKKLIIIYLLIIEDDNHIYFYSISTLKIVLLQLLLVGCKFLIFSHHHSVIDSLNQFLLVKVTSYTMQFIKLLKTFRHCQNPNDQKRKVCCILINEFWCIFHFCWNNFFLKLIVSF